MNNTRTTMSKEGSEEEGADQEVIKSNKKNPLSFLGDSSGFQMASTPISRRLSY